MPKQIKRVLNEGKLQEAERFYRAILQSQPQHPEANHNLGLLAVSVNNADAALPLFKIALEVSPKIEHIWLSYIDVLIKVEQFEYAKEVLQQARKQIFVVEKLNILETQLKLTAQKTEPKLVPQGISPSDIEINSLLEHYRDRRLNDAEKLARSLTQKFPKHQFGWKVLGAIFKQIA